MTKLSQPAGLSRAELRRQLRKARRALSPAAQRHASKKVYRRLSQHPTFRRTRHVAFYLANDGEIDIRPLLLEAQRRGKATYLPVLKAWPRTRMAFQRIRPGEKMVRNRFRIQEPRPQPAMQRKTWALGLILLPLVGFDAHGGRLGMGGGFYDRSLAFKQARRAQCKPVLLGVAHGCQRVDRLPVSSWDVPLDATVTDDGWYRADPSKGFDV
ncbi:5-formyltetrahydrofolate cyclo-ligase [Pseudomonas sp. Marseille-QA0892]